MTIAGAGICKGFSLLGYKLPIVAFRMQRQLQDAESVGISGLTVGLRRREETVRILSSTPYNKLANAMLGIELAAGILRSEPFVVVVVSINNDVRTRVIQNVPQRFDFRIIAVRQPRTE